MECIEKAIFKAIRYRKFNSLITETFDLACVQAKEALKKGKTPFPVVIKDCYMYVIFFSNAIHIFQLCLEICIAVLITVCCSMSCLRCQSFCNGSRQCGFTLLKDNLG